MKAEAKPALVLVALDQHTGAVDDESDGPVLFDLYPRVASACERLRAAGATVGLVAPVGDELAAGTSGPEFDCVYGGSRGLAGALGDAEEEMGRTGVFVSADRTARAVAADRGWAAVPHIDLIDAEPIRPDLRFMRIAGPVDLRALKGYVPYWLERNSGGVESIGAADAATAAAAVARGAEVDVLDGDPRVDDLIRVHIQTGDEESHLALGKRRVLYHRPNASGSSIVVLALGPAEHVDELGIHGPHGHYIMLAPRPELLEAPADADLDVVRAMRLTPSELLELVGRPKPDLAELLASLCFPDSGQFQADVDRYSGAAPLDAAGAIQSRHVRHADNARVVQALLKDLRDIGYCAWTHAFTFEGNTVHNVIAEMPGRGYLVFEPEIHRILREILIKYPWPNPGWRDAADRVLAEHVQDGFDARGLDDWQARSRLEALLGLRVWWPWRCLLAAHGFGARIVLLGCHLDSTAASGPGYNSVTDPAPGADDDASGIATVLAAARRLWQFRNTLTHTVRFAFFNAEEMGLVGSGAYASLLKSSSAPLKAVVCADMTGYNSDVQKIFEIHAGYTDAAVRDLSVPIANKVASVAAAQGHLGPSQIYRGTAWPPPGNADRTLYDGAINRSDHASFQSQGYGAVVVTEDFFANLPGEAAADPNPNYHRPGDTDVDAAYGSEIACAVGEAVRQLAK